MISITRQSTIVFLLSLFWAVSTTNAGILKGFTTTEVPELADVPDIAAMLKTMEGRNLEGEPTEPMGSSKDSSSGKGSSGKGSSKSRSSKSSKKSKKGKRRPKPEYPDIPIAAPDFDEDGVLSFVIVSF